MRVLTICVLSLCLAVLTSCGPRADAEARDDPEREPARRATADQLTSAIMALRPAGVTDGIPMLRHPQQGPAVVMRLSGTDTILAPRLHPSTLSRAARADTWRGAEGEDIDLLHLYMSAGVVIERAAAHRERGAHAQSLEDIETVWRTAHHVAAYGAVRGFTMGAALRERAARELAQLRESAQDPELGGDWLGQPFPNVARALATESLRQELDVLRRSPEMTAAQRRRAQAQVAISAPRVAQLASALAAPDARRPGALREARREICDGRWQWGDWNIRSIAFLIRLGRGDAAADGWYGERLGAYMATWPLDDIERAQQRLSHADALLGRLEARPRVRACASIPLNFG